MNRKYMFRNIVICALCFVIFTGCAPVNDSVVVDTAPDAYTYVTNNMSISIPAEWEGMYECLLDGERLAIFHKESYHSWGGGWICSFMKFTDELYLEYPAYDVLKETEEAVYIITYPTDVQFDPAGQKSTEEYMNMFEEVDLLIESFEVIE